VILVGELNEGKALSLRWMLAAALTSVFITPTMPSTTANAKTIPVNFLIFVIVDIPP
jgi:hypothetical protein